MCVSLCGFASLFSLEFYLEDCTGKMGGDGLTWIGEFPRSQPRMKRAVRSRMDDASRTCRKQRQATVVEDPQRIATIPNGHDIAAWQRRRKRSEEKEETAHTRLREQNAGKSTTLLVRNEKCGSVSIIILRACVLDFLQQHTGNIGIAI